MNQTTRRSFLQAASVSRVAGRAPAASPARIDCQSHLFSEEFLRWLEKRPDSPRVERVAGERYLIVGPWRRRVLPKHTDVAAKLADMDRAGVRLAALSINDPGPELFGRDSAAVARELNDFIADVVSRHPDRFLGLAVLPFDPPEAMLKELERATSKPDIKGILLYSNINGRFPDEEPFRPLFEEAERRGLPLLLHPACPVTYEATQGYEMAAGLGLMFDTTIALCRIILAGLLEKHPRLKLVCPHTGGALPYLIGRVDHQVAVLKRGGQHIRRAPSHYLKQVWFDTVNPLGLGIRYVWQFAGPHKLLYASDHPWVDPQLIVEQIESQRFPEADLERIWWRNATELFGLKPEASQ